MEGNVRAKRLDNPLAFLGDLAVGIVVTGDQKRRDFEPDVGFTLQPDQRVLHRLEV